MISAFDDSNPKKIDSQIGNSQFSDKRFIQKMRAELSPATKKLLKIGETSDERLLKELNFLQMEIKKTILKYQNAFNKGDIRSSISSNLRVKNNREVYNDLLCSGDPLKNMKSSDFSGGSLLSRNDKVCLSTNKNIKFIKIDNNCI